MMLLLLTLSFFAPNSFACSPHRYPIGSQIGELRMLVESQKVMDQIISCGGAAVKKIEQKEGGNYLVVLTDKSSFQAKMIWKQPSDGGLCPSLEGVEILNAACRR
jgi:hypothetical protein